MSANCPVPRLVGVALSPVLAALVLAGCNGPATIEPAAPSAEEIRASEQALEAAAAAEKQLPPAAGR